MAPDETPVTPESTQDPLKCTCRCCISSRDSGGPGGQNPTALKALGLPSCLPLPRVPGGEKKTGLLGNPLLSLSSGQELTLCQHLHDTMLSQLRQNSSPWPTCAEQWTKLTGCLMWPLPGPSVSSFDLLWAPVSPPVH